MSSTPPSGVLAELPGLAGSAPAGAIARDGKTSAPASGPLPSRAGVNLAAVAPDFRGGPPPAVPPGMLSDTRALDARALDTRARRPEPTSAAHKSAAHRPAALRPAALKPAALKPAADKPAAHKPAALAEAPAPVKATPKRIVRAAGRPASLWAQLRHQLTVTGMATWYPGTRGYAGIPHVAMPGARYLTRGRTAPRALVCAGRRCTVVRVVDACACSVGTRRARVVDLSATALNRLGLDRRYGVYQVRVTLLAP